MYARKWPLPVYLYSLLCAFQPIGSLTFKIVYLHIAYEYLQSIQNSAMYHWPWWMTFTKEVRSRMWCLSLAIDFQYLNLPCPPLLGCREPKRPCECPSFTQAAGGPGAPVNVPPLLRQQEALTPLWLSPPSPRQQEALTPLWMSPLFQSAEGPDAPVNIPPSSRRPWRPCDYPPFSQAAEGPDAPVHT